MSVALDPDFERLLEFVRDARGFDYTGYRRPTLLRRFEKRMQDVGVSSWDDYRTYLERNNDEFAQLFNTILINVTGFFRDRETWDVVASEVIPQVLEARDPSAPIRVWSAGCASGEEPYTISMLLAEALGDEAYKARVKIYATDVDDDALAEAREASYKAKQLSDVPEDLRERYFQPANGGFAFRSDLRRSVIFGRNDLHKDPPISRVDLLVSRNTLMYFSPEIQERILVNFYFALKRGGYLVVGKAEALQQGRRLFAPHNLKRRIFVKNGTAELGFHVPPLKLLPDLEPGPGVELGDAAFEHGPVAQLVVDKEDRLAAVNQAARALFKLKVKDVGRPLHELEVSYRPVELRALIDDARGHRRAAGVKDVRWELPDGVHRSFDVSVAPLLGINDPLSGVSIAFVDVTPYRALEGQLDRTRRELETAYEELQSTVEELETTNEELQSTNEELETMNEELESTNEELETINDEMRERTDDTLRSNAFLTSVLASIFQAVVVVDRELRVIAWSSQATELLGLREDEVEGAHLLNLDVGLPVQELRDPVRRALEREEQPPIEVGGHNRRGQAVRYTIAFAQLDGTNAEAAAGVILLITALPV